MASIQLELESLFNAVLDKEASDIFLVAGQKPVLRVKNELFLLSEQDVLTSEHIREVIFFMLSDEQKKELEEAREIEIAYNFKDVARFRASVYYQRNNVSATLRYIPLKIRTPEELNLPPVIQSFYQATSGLVLFTGPTGSGKSTTIASLLDAVNHTQAKHIITIEDPIEYLIQHDRSLVEQRQVGSDTVSVENSIEMVLRQRPDIIMVGEVFSAKTFERVLTIAETGHLVYVALPTSFAAPTIEWLINLFPTSRHDEIQTRIGNVLRGVLTQRLVTAIEGGQIPATEILLTNSTVKGLIRKGQLFQLDDVIMTHVAEGMLAFDRSLAHLVSDQSISKEEALKNVLDAQAFDSLLTI